MKLNLNLLLAFGAGYLAARYMILNMGQDQYEQKEDQLLGKLQTAKDRVAAWIQEYHPEVDSDTADSIAGDLVGNVPSGNGNSNGSASNFQGPVFGYEDTQDVLSGAGGYNEFGCMTCN